MEVVRAEIHEMEADFNNLETNARQVTRRKNHLSFRFHFQIKIRDLWGKPLLRKCLLILGMAHAAQHFTGSFVVRI